VGLVVYIETSGHLAAKLTYGPIVTFPADRLAVNCFDSDLNY